jgi:hypothetical protein
MVVEMTHIVRQRGQNQGANTVFLIVFVTCLQSWNIVEKLTEYLEL